MLALSRMGAVMIPPVPSFYNHPKTLAEMVDHIVARDLDQFGLETPNAARGITSPMQFSGVCPRDLADQVHAIGQRWAFRVRTDREPGQQCGLPSPPKSWDGYRKKAPAESSPRPFDSALACFQGECR